MQTLTILHVVFSSRLAGGENHCIDLAQAQAELGHRVHVAAPSKAAIRPLLGDQVQFHGLPLPFLMRGPRINRLARQLRADVVHGHLGPACRATAWASSAARIGTLHVGYKAHQHARLDGLVCVNAEQAQVLAGFAGLHRTINNWAPQRTAASRGARCDGLRQTLHIPPTAPVVLCTGRLNPIKGMDVLIEAFQRFAPANAHLVLLGDGPERARLSALSAGNSRIHLPGFFWNATELLAEVDLYVSASREEAAPLVLLEAMRAGVPIVSTTTQGARHILAGQAALLVPPGDNLALGRAIETSLAHAAPQVSTGTRPQVAYDLQHFDRFTAVHDTLALYRDVISRRFGREVIA